MTAAVLAAVLASCGGEPADGGAREVDVADVLADPAAYDGRRIRFTASYVGSFERTVLAEGLAESYPPQPVEPSIWVAATPEGPCLTTDLGVTWGEVVAEGVFRHDEDGGFGHLGVWTMELDEPRLACP